MRLAAKEEMFSTCSDPCVLFPLAAFEGIGENSRLGSATRKTALHRGTAWSNSARALGIEEVLLGSGVGCRSSGNSSGYHFQLFPSSLRLPGESFGACVDRTQTALLGDTGKGLLGGITGASLVTSIFTSSPGTTLAAAGKIQGEVVNNLGAQISGDVIQTQLVPKPSIAANAINEGIAAGSVPADVGAAAVKGANFLGKFASVLTAIGVGIEGGFLVSCR